MVSQITSFAIVYSTVYSGADQREHQSSASLAFVRRGIHRWPVNSPHKSPVKRKMFPFDDVIISWHFATQMPSHKCFQAQFSLDFLKMEGSLGFNSAFIRICNKVLDLSDMISFVITCITFKKKKNLVEYISKRYLEEESKYNHYNKHLPKSA